MDRTRVEELHHITHFSNLQLILQRGILSHRRMERLSHQSIASQSVQDRRSGIRIPQGRKLHEYVPLYFNARNVMMYVLDHKDELAVLRIDSAVMDLPDVVISDRNAASGVAAFYRVGEGIAALDETFVYATWWNQSFDAKQRRCAEVLVPDRIDPSFIRGVYVLGPSGEDLCRGVVPSLEPTLNPDLFFTAES